MAALYCMESLCPDLLNRFPIWGILTYGLALIFINNAAIIFQYQLFFLIAIISSG